MDNVELTTIKKTLLIFIATTPLAFFSCLFSFLEFLFTRSYAYRLNLVFVKK